MMVSLSNRILDVVSEINLNTWGSCLNFHGSSRSRVRKHDNFSDFASSFTFNLFEVVQTVVVIVSERLVNSSSGSVDCLVFFFFGVTLCFGKFSEFSLDVWTFSEIEFRMFVQFSTFFGWNPAWSSWTVRICVDLNSV